MTRPSSTSRPALGMSWVVPLVSLAWFGLDVVGVWAQWWGEDLTLVIALVGILLLVVAHERQSGGRWLTGMALAALPALVLLSGPLLTSDIGVSSASIVVLVGALLVAASMAGAALVRRRWGEAADSGGSSYFG